jgi:hypothetical protein
MVADRRSLASVGPRRERSDLKVVVSMLAVLGVVVAEAIHAGQPAWVLTGIIGPAVLAVAVVRHWPRRFRR